MRAKHLLNLVGDTLHTLPIAILYLTDGCNSRCVMCDIWRSPRRNMDMALVDSLVESFRKLNTRWVLLSGGEAMQHPQWPQIAQKLRAAGIYVMLHTNGLLVKKQIDDVLGSVDEVITSMDAGNAATYDAIRGVDAFDLVLEGIRLVRAGGLPVTTRTTVMRANYREIPDIIAACKSADVNHISFLTVDVSNPFAFGPRFSADTSIPVAMDIPNDHMPPSDALTPKDVEQLEAILAEVETRFADDFSSGRLAESPAKLRNMLTYFGAVNGSCDFEGPRCNAPRTTTVIEVDGTLRPCYFLPGWGKLDGRPLTEVLNADEARALRKQQRLGQRGECARCVCPLYKGPRALLRL